MNLPLPRAHWLRFTRRRAVGIAAIVWLALGIAGSAALARYAYTPASAAEPPVHWPAGTSISHAAGVPVLVMLAHPQCGCTAASLEELARFMVGERGRVEANVVFLRPEGYPEGWERTRLWKSANEIPGVHTRVDVGGREAGLFGSWTSGQTLLYDAKGELRFSGGISEGRGHAGDNAGLDALRRAAQFPGGGVLRSSVFGCSLRTPHGVS